MKNLSNIELLSLLKAYDNYIQNANEEELYNYGWKPVCINEFYQNDYEFWSDDNE